MSVAPTDEASRQCQAWQGFSEKIFDPSDSQMGVGFSVINKSIVRPAPPQARDNLPLDPATESYASKVVTSEEWRTSSDNPRRATVKL